MTTPKALLMGLTFIAIAIASIPYSNNVITPAFANSNKVHKIAICDADADPRNITTNNIDLTSKNGEILNGRTNHRVAYYATQLDALNNKQQKNFSKHWKIKMCLLKKLPNNFMMKKITNF